MNTQREGSRNGQRKVRPTGSEQTAGGPSKGQWESGVGGQAKAAQTQREAKGKATAQQWQANERAVERKREARRRAGTRVGNQIRKSPPADPAASEEALPGATHRSACRNRCTRRCRRRPPAAQRRRGRRPLPRRPLQPAGRCQHSRGKGKGRSGTGRRGSHRLPAAAGARLASASCLHTSGGAVTTRRCQRCVSVCVSFSLCAVPVISGDFG